MVERACCSCLVCLLAFGGFFHVSRKCELCKVIIKWEQLFLWIAKNEMWLNQQLAWLLLISLLMTNAHERIFWLRVLYFVIIDGNCDWLSFIVPCHKFCNKTVIAIFNHILGKRVLFLVFIDKSKKKILFYGIGIKYKFIENDYHLQTDWNHILLFRLKLIKNQ